MKTLALVFVLASVIAGSIAEPPRRQFSNQRQQNFGFFQQQQQQQQNFPNNFNNGDSGPYAPSGWRPEGAQFRLPERQQQQPQVQYGAPQPSNQYGPPANEYGPPASQQYNAPINQKQSKNDERDKESVTEPSDFEAENLKSEKLKNAKQQESLFKNTDRGLYYVYLPDGRLQRVVYMTSADLQNMAYTARVQYEDVDPVAAPVYTIVNDKPVVNGAIIAQRLILP